MTPTLTIGDVAIPIRETPQGPKVAKTDPALEPLAWLVNIALEGHLPELVPALERGEDVHHESVHAVCEGERMYRVSVDFLSTATHIPAATIIEVFSRLSALKKQPKRGVVPPPVEPPPPRPATEPLVRGPLPKSWQELEQHAVELDRMVMRDRTPAHFAEEARVRRILWHDMSDMGVFERVPVPLPDDAPTLRAYQAASQQLGKYLESEERARFNPDARPTRIVEAPVSLDWFRVPSQPGPSRLSAFEWLSYLESVLTSHERYDDRGEIAVRIGDSDWWALYWRADDGDHPAVVAVTHISK